MKATRRSRFVAARTGVVPIPIGDFNNPVGVSVHVVGMETNAKDIDMTVLLARQHSAVIAVGTMMEESRTEMALPVLSRIPYVSRLVRNVSYGLTSSQLYLIVTPRMEE